MITVNYNNCSINYAYGVTQYDYGQILHITGAKIPDNTEVHFCQKDETIIQYLYSNQVQIPDYMLQFQDNINVYIYRVNENSGKTIKKIVLKIQPREKPGDYMDPEKPAYTRLLPTGGENGEYLSIVDENYAWVDPSLEFVPQEIGKGLISDAEKAKLEGIEMGAKVNVQADWNDVDTKSDAYIKNKPTKLSQFTNDTGLVIPDDKGHIAVDTVKSDNYRFKQEGKVYATFGTPNLLNATLVPGIFNSKFDYYDMNHIYFYCSDSEEGEDWVPYLPVNYSETRKKNLFNGDIATAMYFELGLHKRFAIQIDNDGNSYYWLEYFTFICSSSRSKIAFSMEAYSEYLGKWVTVVKKQETGKTSEHYPLEVLHPSIKFDFRADSGKYQKIRYTFYTISLYEPNDLTNAYNRFAMQKFRHYGSYPANTSSLNTIRNGVVQDSEGNAYVKGKFRARENSGFASNDLISRKFADDTYTKTSTFNNTTDTLNAKLKAIEAEMINIYVTLIIAGQMRYSDIQADIKEPVKQALTASGHEALIQ